MAAGCSSAALQCRPPTERSFSRLLPCPSYNQTHFGPCDAINKIALLDCREDAEQPTAGVKDVPVCDVDCL